MWCSLSTSCLLDDCPVKMDYLKLEELHAQKPNTSKFSCEVECGTFSYVLLDINRFSLKISFHKTHHLVKLTESNSPHTHRGDHWIGMFFFLSIKFKDEKNFSIRNTNTLKDQQDLWVKEQFQDSTPFQTLNHKIKLEISICIFFMNSTTSLLHWKRGYINRIREEEDK